MDLRELIEATQAETVGRRLIIGERGTRRVIAEQVAGVWGLTEEGRRLVAQLEKQRQDERGAAARRTRAKKEKPAPAPADEPAAAPTPAISPDDIAIELGDLTE